MHSLVLPTDAPVVAGPPQGCWTYADWERLPADEQRYEVIGGVLYMTTARSSFHQWIVQTLFEYIGIPVKRQQLGYAFVAPIGVLMPGCDPVQPDFVVVLNANAGIIREQRIRGVPDLLIEVLSPGTRAYDEQTKWAAYAAAGVPEYALVDPETRTVQVYRLEPGGAYGVPQVMGAGETLRFACLPTIDVPVAELFAGAPDTTL
jgi:Uma2 family endonuclease